MPEDTVLFVCRHGAAKSLVAARRLERLARERGMRPLISENYRAARDAIVSRLPALLETVGR